MFVAVCRLSLVVAHRLLTVAGSLVSGAWSVGMQGLQWLWCGALVAPQQMESSQTRDQTRIPCTGRRILNPWDTREVLVWGVFCYHGLPLETEAGTEDLGTDGGEAWLLNSAVACDLYSSAFAGCKTITSAVLVHCLRQKKTGRDELLE